MQKCKTFRCDKFYGSTLEWQLNQYLRSHPTYSVRAISTSMEGRTTILVVVFDAEVEDHG